MSSIRKTFNFRDGVQVDDDDLVVRGGLVGIGSTVPSEKLDVNGNIRAVGVVTSRDHFVTGVSTIGELRVLRQAVASLQPLLFMVMVRLFLIFQHHNGLILM
jgi:hypothetical protein